MGTVYKPRKSFVVVCVVSLGKMQDGRIHLPDSAIEGKQYIVHAIGPDVKDLNIGDKVLMQGNQGSEWGYMPGTREFIVIDERNVVLVFEDKPEIVT